MSKIELVSLHIPKTGGRTFKQTLRSVYGDTLDETRNRGKLFNSPSVNTSLLDLIPPHVKVVHGHLEYKHIHDIVNKYNPKIVTWLRDPVARVVSNYFFVMRKAFEGKETFFDSETSLIDYANHESNKNLMSTFLKGIDLESLFFAGTLENFDNDLEHLSKMLKWKNYKKGIYSNSNKSFKEDPQCKTKTVTNEMREEILKLNLMDQQLYEKALALRKSYRKNNWFSFFKISK